ncbi:MAG: hypothetical protein M3347_03395 [Armatimonadota bacterium]|nr:hypothetical protein [Armatimonadota bacterium]
MAVSVKKVTLWRREVDNKAGVLADTLEPLANAGANLQVVMGYRYPGNESQAAIELYPVSGRKATAAAQAAGLSVSAIPTLLVEGDNQPGLGYAIARAIADAGVNMGFVVAQVLGDRYSAILGFESDDDARNAATLIKRATAAHEKTAAQNNG